MPATIAVVVKGYPRLSETFIAQEIRALELQGFNLIIVSLRHPYDSATHPIHAEINAACLYLPEYIHDDYGRVFRAWWSVRKKPGYGSAWRAFLRHFRRDFSVNRLRRFAQGMVMASEMPASVGLYYTHFMHTPSSVSYYASLVTGVPWSISAHAKDIWTISDWERREKLANARWAVTCTSANADFLSGLADDPQKVELLYHGLDFDRFDMNKKPPSTRDGSNADEPVRLISVGRAVDKKGYDYLLEALANLPRDIYWQFLHIGDGELLQTLRQQADTLGIGKHIRWLGALPQTEVLDHYRHADLFVLSSKISADGDRDGLPNVLMEAQSQRLACLSTAISGIPELIEHARTGWLVEQKNSRQLTRALQDLIGDPELRNRLAQAGCTRVREHFSMHRGIAALGKRLTQTLAEGAEK